MQTGLNNERDLPDALVIGPMRSATTWIHRYLKSRDDVCLPTDVKETFFFDRRFSKGLGWYSRHFRSRQSSKFRTTVEVGPSYFHSKEAPTRIRDVLGQIPLIVVYRDPVERSFSHFAHLRRYGFTNLPLREATEEFPEVLAASKYAEQLERWVEHFEEDCIRILRLQTLKDSPVQFAASLNQALRLPKQTVPEELRTPVNQSTVPESNFFAGVAWRVADILRGWRLHKVVELAKQAGVKDAVMESTAGERSEMSESERMWLREQLEEDMRRAPEILSEIEDK
jgi:hypothetical protein